MLQLACSAQPSCVRMPSAPGKILKNVLPAINHEHSRQILKVVWCCEVFLRIFHDVGRLSHLHGQPVTAAAAGASRWRICSTFKLFLYAPRPVCLICVCACNITQTCFCTRSVSWTCDQSLRVHVCLVARGWERGDARILSFVNCDLTLIRVSSIAILICGIRDARVTGTSRR